MTEPITPFDEVVRLYVEDRCTIQQIVDLLGLSRFKVRQILHVAEVQKRPPGGSRNGSRNGSRDDNNTSLPDSA